MAQPSCRPHGSGLLPPAVKHHERRSRRPLRAGRTPSLRPLPSGGHAKKPTPAAAVVHARVLLNWLEPAKDRLGSQPRHPNTGRAATQREPDRVATPGRIHDGGAFNDCPARCASSIRANLGGWRADRRAEESPGSSGCGGWQVDGWLHLLSVNGKGSSRLRSYESLDMLLAARTTRRPPSSGGNVVRRTHPTESPVRWRLHRVWAMSHVGSL